VLTFAGRSPDEEKRLTAAQVRATLSYRREGEGVTTLTIRLPEQLRTDLKKLSRQEHKAVSDIVRDSLRRHVAVQQFRSLRRKILPFAEAQGLVTDEDVFKALS